MKTAMKKQNYGVKRRAKWGSKTRNGKPVEHLTYEITGFELKDAVDFEQKYNDGKTILASMIIEGHDQQWTQVMRDAVKKFLFEQ